MQEKNIWWVGLFAIAKAYLLFIRWPNSLFSPDILFLIPMPWRALAIIPVLIACLTIIYGLLVVVSKYKGQKIKLSMIEWITLIAGVFILLVSFMQDALLILPIDVETLLQLRIAPSNWLISIFGLVITGYVVLNAIWPYNED